MSNQVDLSKYNCICSHYPPRNVIVMGVLDRTITVKVKLVGKDKWIDENNNPVRNVWYWRFLSTKEK